MEGNCLINSFSESHLLECEEYEGQDCICSDIKEEKYWDTVNSQIDYFIMEVL